MHPHLGCIAPGRGGVWLQRRGYGSDAARPTCRFAPLLSAAARAASGAGGLCKNATQSRAWLKTPGLDEDAPVFDWEAPPGLDGTVPVLIGRLPGGLRIEPSC
jgi:hypothetical protein